MASDSFHLEIAQLDHNVMSVDWPVLNFLGRKDSERYKMKVKR